ncbi:MAG: lipopolysaccharide biosynthesis protein [Bacteroidetes bacterium]|jgi:O-antigen/teichoic acid export membrane protein|nr:lipopolysaccharide biosynthesis protein [Chloroflexota bacterium]MBT6834779.1 lipopolysaccharide biosynthesis protein [Bacteroidota bacterium]MBT4002498.1 lipopolysaccharide biosynthesis protein [Chloroflexota bacterium]MBT4306215.1 lipopolysaccharide biosynthesis protein [Chloroflexota bacterium]MBT4534996.1 lipopolysaccharide biosynthesis protein [Chloroflexota bacterium]
MDNKNKFGALQFIKNIVSNGGLFVINTVISFWFTPYLLRSLGSEHFGFIPLVNSVVNYFGIITLSLNASTGRYLMIELEREDDEKSNQIFNTSLVGILAMILVAIPVGALLVYYASDIFQVPVDSKRDIQFLLIGSLFAFFLTTLRSGFSIASFSQNRFDLRNMLSFMGRLGQVGIVLLLFTIDQPNLIYVGTGIIVVSLISLMGDLYLWKKLLPVLKIKLGMFNKDLFKDMLGTNFWMLINRIGFLIFMNIEMIVANRYFSLSMAGMYGALLTIPNNLRTIANTVSGVWGPLIISKYGRDDISGIDRVAKTSIKLVGLAIALPIGFVSGVSGEFLGFWIGTEYIALKWVAVVMAFNILINTVTLPLTAIFRAMNKVKIPAVITGLTGIVYFIVSILLAKQFGEIGLAAAGGIVLSFRNIFFVSIYSAFLMKKKWWHYLVNLIQSPIITIIVALISYCLMQIVEVQNFLELLVVGGVISIIYGICAYKFGLSQNEKDTILGIVKQKTRRIYDKKNEK